MRKTERRFTSFTTIREYVDILAAKGDRPLFRYFVKNEERAMDYGTFAAQVKTEAAGICALGLAGKRIAVIGASSPEWIATYVAILASGSVAIPMDRELATHEIEGFLQSVEASAIFYDASFHEKFTETRASHPTLTHFIPFSEIEDGENGKVVSFASFLAAGKKQEADGYVFPERNREDMAEMLFTSGTTGTSKCVMLSEKNICFAVNSACATVEFFPEDTIVSVLPLHHTYELCCVLAGMDYGHTIGINDSLRHIMRNFALFRPTGLVLVPLIVNTMYHKIQTEIAKQGKEKQFAGGVFLSNTLRHIGIDKRASLFGNILQAFGGRLNKIICGGAALDPKMVKAYADLGINVYEGYGITECSPLVAVNPYYAPKKGSVGTPVPGCTVRIDGSAKNDRGFTEGEIQVKGDNVMLGYYNAPEENAKAFTADGWFRTGDIGYLDKDGYLYITGRIKSVIVLDNGKNVFPEEIEEYLSKVDEISEAVVVGRRTGAGGTLELVAVVVPNEELFPETPDDEILSVLEKRVHEISRKLPSYKAIAKIELRKEPFEKTTSKKIKRFLVH